MKKMQHSGIPWIGDIPEEWASRRLKTCFQLQSLKAERQGSVVSLENVESWTGRYIETDSQYEGAGILFSSGDILFGKLRPNLAKVYLAPDSGTALGDWYVLSPSQNMDSRYSAFLMRSPTFIDHIVASTYGAKMPRVSWSFMANMEIPAPSIQFQQRIADYLDKKCMKIDETIEHEKHVIEKLKIYKQSVITEAVTKGLNPNAPMKESGIEWIGKIPEHWELRRLRFLCAITTGDKDTVNRKSDGLYPFYVRSPHIERIDTYTFDGEAILMAGDGVGAGKVFHYVSGKFDYHQRVYNLYKFTDVIGKYLFYFLRENFWKKIEEGNAKSTVDSVRLPMLLNFPVTFGSEAEQQQIADYLDKKCDGIDTAIAKKEALIERLAAYKKSLIYECVTGKKEVV